MEATRGDDAERHRKQFSQVGLGQWRGNFPGPHYGSNYLRQRISEAGCSGLKSSHGASQPRDIEKLNDAEKAKKELEQQEYFDPKLADEEREKGNEYFKQQKYPEAIKHYTESLRRNPKDPKAYSNRAACYTKLGAMPEGLKDAEKCIELDPTFTKGYTRKGAVQFFMKEYEKALETYQEGLKHDAGNQELLDGVRRCVQQINKASRGDLSPDELKERQAKGMQDPEIQNILQDPVMRQVLIDFQENPKAAQEHTKNPMVMNKIQKLVSAGIVQLR
ncbi:hsp70-Hsp90 organizing protein 3-like [Prunus yedoensis var. nudiflora]|uniref:Hsp70-Hsp90 organizing protein 3-like n=1 Tax=Prunus yedoensis var. nudiflora TaxID=2094558 RepID=A0A315B0F3_PRUYE|nr:hsp70-Hsp90 organizing protein 3-like [Prunus yedoensis var. nudiflora]